MKVKHYLELIQNQYYRRALTEGSSEVAYGRVMFLGPAGVGKSCFKRGLMNLEFKPKINSTILADVQSVRPADIHRGPLVGPLSREWVMGSSWSEVTEEDEIQELAQLLVLVGTVSSRGATDRHSSTPPGKHSNLMCMLESEILQRAFAKARALKVCDVNQLKCQPLFHLWDCGGQPVFLEVLPIFLTSRTVFLLFFNAFKDLKQQWESVYHKDGQKFTQGKVNMSTLEMMHRWITLIYSHLLKKDHQAVDPGYPRVIPIGTRGDELKACGKNPDEVVKEIDDSIKEKAGLYHVLKQPVIVDNTTSGTGENEDPGYRRVRKEIFDITQTKLSKETPISWILFRKLLQILPSVSESQSTNIISLEDVYTVSAIAQVQHGHVLSMLSFYHELGVLLYYPNIEGLKNKVILNPKWFIECLGKVLALPRAEEYEDKAEWELLRSKGILVQRLYTNVWRKCQGIDPDEFIDLLTHFQLAVKVETKVYFDRQSKQYFVPAVLPYTASSPTIGGENSTHIKSAPLHVTFNTGFAIPGFFTRLSTAMLKAKDNCLPKLRLFFENGIYHNQVTYKMQSLLSHFVTLTEHTDTIEINFSCSSFQPHTEVQTCCANLKALSLVGCEDVANGLQSLHTNITEMITSFELKVVCQAEQCKGQEIHYLASDPIKENISGSVHTLVVCERDEANPRNITLEEAYWYPKCTLPLDNVSPFLDSQSLNDSFTGPPIHCLMSFDGSNLSRGKEESDSQSLDTGHDVHQPSMPTTKTEIKEDELMDVYNLLKSKYHKWNEIGRELGVMENFLQVQQGIFTSAKQKLEAVIHKWHESKYLCVTWEHLASVMRKLEFNDVADDIMKRLFSIEPDSQSHMHKPLAIRLNTGTHSETDTDHDAHRYQPSMLTTRTKIKEDELMDVYNLLKSKHQKWNEIGKELKVMCDFLQVQKIVHTNTKQKLEAVIHKWHKSKCSDVTWEHLASVMRKLDFNDVAGDIVKCLFSIEPDSKPSIPDMPIPLAIRLNTGTHSQRDESVPKLEIFDVHKQLVERSADWNEIGQRLGVSLNYRKGLERDNTSNSIKLEKVLDEWSQSECSEVSWNKIIEMLKDLGWNKIVKQVKQYLQKLSASMAGKNSS